MINSLPLFHRVAGQPVIVLGEGEAGEAKRRLVERAGAVIVAEDNLEARLAFVALERPEEVAARLKARGLLVNVTDRPDLCDFTVPSLLERGPVLVAVGTGGVSAGLAKALRLRLEALLPSTLGQLAEMLEAAKAKLRAQWSDAAERRRVLDAALAQGGPLDPLDAGSATRVEDWLAGAPSVSGAVHHIVLRSADPDDLTLREARLLGTADVIIHELGVPGQILARARADAVRRRSSDGQPDPPEGVVVVLTSP